VLDKAIQIKNFMLFGLDYCFALAYPRLALNRRANLLAPAGTRSHSSPAIFPHLSGNKQQPSSTNCSKSFAPPLPSEIQSGPLGNPQFGSASMALSSSSTSSSSSSWSLLLLFLSGLTFSTSTRSQISPAMFPQRRGRRQQPSSANCSRLVGPSPGETQSGPSGKPQLNASVRVCPEKLAVE
jgi:hypothetical protein